MTTTPLTRWILPAVLAAGMTAAAFVPVPAHAQSGDDLMRVIVDVADVVLRGNQPYYRGNDNDRLLVSYDPRGRPTYYRMSPRRHNVVQYRNPPPRHVPAQRWNGPQQVRRETCDRRGRCTVQYYDPRQDRSRDRRWR